MKLRNIDSPFEGTAIISDQQAGDLVAGKWFILIRTAASPAASCADSSCATSVPRASAALEQSPLQERGVALVLHRLEPEIA